jgi:hypothetical protein
VTKFATVGNDGAPPQTPALLVRVPVTAPV